MKKDDIWISVADWYGKSKMVCLRKTNYVFGLASAKTPKAALNAASRKLKQLSEECLEMAKPGKKDED